ncbi:hypothetical protein AAOGI_00210 [Agarivorans albus]
MKVNPKNLLFAVLTTGTALLREALARVGRPCRLYTFQENRAARQFYEKQGFEAIEFTDGSANEENVPDVLYELV